MALKHPEEFKRDAVRIALTGGLMRRQASSDSGVGRLMRKNGISVVRTTSFNRTNKRISAN